MSLKIKAPCSKLVSGVIDNTSTSCAYLVLVTEERGVPQCVQLLLGLPHQGVEPRLHVR